MIKQLVNGLPFVLYQMIARSCASIRRRMRSEYLRHKYNHIHDQSNAKQKGESQVAGG